MRCDAVTGIAGALLRMDSPWEVALPKEKGSWINHCPQLQFFLPLNDHVWTF